MSETKTRIKQILNDCCAGNATLATDILDQEFVIIPKSDLPTVKRSEHDPDTYCTDRENVVYTSEENAQTWCLRDVAVWQFIKDEAKSLNTRRDELARELVSDGAYAYRFAEEPLRTAIDRIIELEKAA